MFSLKKTVIAIALAFPLAASAQSMQEIKAELDALKSQVKKLEGLVEQANAKADSATTAATAATAATATVAGGGFDDDTRADFNRVKMKTEGLEDQMEASGFKGLKISGFMDPTYIYNQRQQTSSFVFMKNFNDQQANGGTNSAYAYDNANFGSALVRIEKEMEGGTKWTLELMPHKSGGDAAGFNSGSIVNQAFVSVPLGSLNDKFLAGQISSWPGYEFGLSGGGISSKKTITNNLLFDFTEPTFMTGAGYEHISGAWDSKAIIANLNNGRVTDRRAPVLHWRTDYTINEFQGVGFSGLHGKTSGSTSINYLEADTFYTRGRVNLQGQLEVGRAPGAAFNGGTSQWVGLSTLASYKMTSRLEGIARFDYIKNDKNGGGVPGIGFSPGCQSADPTDPTGATTMPSNCGDYRNGFGPGINNATGLVADPNRGANRMALTLGLDYALTPNAMLKFEARYDRATQNTFFDVGSNTYKKDNTLLGASTVISF